ncbi:thioredoxin family protein [Formosa sp. S-31]|uniref:thioredoxin family protein n=1 Tax=Formosa sp. S-31 TaxID=2790949 RepID=UPI003EBB975C
MKNILFPFLVLVLSVQSVLAQGMEFQHLTLKEALAKAESENKLVFIDFYTVWCGPCKVMAKNVFTLPEVGAVYNAEYINIKLDAEKEGMEAAKQFKVNSYPTYVYLNSNGNLVFKESGTRMPEEFIALGKDAVAAVNSEYSLEKLQANFPNKKTDAEFLKIYIEKMLEYGQNPALGVDAWLKVQNEIEEADVDMMEFLLKYKEYILLDSKGSDILNANFDEYMDIATRSEEKELEVLKVVRMAQNTKNYAYETKDPELWLRFMEAFNTLPEKYKKKGNLLEYKMIYYSLLNDGNSYKEVVETYVDSLMADKTMSEIKAEDQAAYEKRGKALEGNPAPQAQQMLVAYKDGIKSAGIVKEIDQKGEAYLKYTDSKSDYKTLESWIEYGNALEAASYYMDNLTANMYYKKGKTKKAVTYKEKALAEWPKDDKKVSTIQYELEQMKNGEAL